MGFSIGVVIDNVDPADGGRIKVKVLPADKHTSFDKIPYAFPLMPKMMHVTPKIGEEVIIFSGEEGNQQSQRMYIGPIISQPQFHYFESSDSATALLRGGPKKEDIAPSNQRNAIGAFADNEDVAIYGRKDCDIILSDDDIRIRCGARLHSDGDKSKVSFNKENPAFIKLKYHSDTLDMGATAAAKIGESHAKVKSTVNIVGDKINFISPYGDPYINIGDQKEGISDDDIVKFMNEAHRVPYGDVLVNFLSMLLKMFKSHTHKYHNLPPCPDQNSINFDTQYGYTENDYSDKLLSKDIRIN